MRMNKKLDYEYWIEIIHEVEEFTRNKITVKPDYFKYDGLDFAPALERSLYFEIFGNMDYLAQIKKARLNNGKVYLKSVTHELILKRFLENNHVRYTVRMSLVDLIKSLFFRNKLFINLYLTIKKKSFLVNNNNEAEYAFIIIHQKFIRYLSPVYNRLADKSVFIICDDIVASVDLCEKQNFRYMIPEESGFIHSSSSPELLNLAILYSRYKNTYNKINPSVLIVPEGNSSIYELFNLIGNKKRTKTICIQQGWSPVFHNGFRKMHYDIFLSWGEEFSNLLKKYNPEQKFMMTGNHAIDVEKNPNKKNSIVLLDQGVNTIISNDIHDAFINFAIHLSLEYKHMEIIFREHPGKSMKDEERYMLEKHGIKFMNSDKYALSEVLSGSFIAISFYSTTLFEAMLYDAIPFAFNLTDLPNLEPDLNQLGMGMEAKSYQDACEKISLLMTDSTISARIKNTIVENKNRFFYAYGQDALNLIVDAITNSTGYN